MLKTQITALTLTLILSGGLPAADGEKAPKAYAGTSAHTFNASSPDLRQKGNWGEWKLWYIFKGSRSEGLHGELVTDGRTVVGSTIGEKVTLGENTWVWHGAWDDRKHLFSKSGWLPEDLSVISPSWSKKAKQGASDKAGQDTIVE